MPTARHLARGDDERELLMQGRGNTYTENSTFSMPDEHSNENESFPDNAIHDSASEEGRQVNQDPCKRRKRFTDARRERGKDQMKFVIVVLAMIVVISITFSQSISRYVISNYDKSVAHVIMIVYMIVGVLVIFTMYRWSDIITENPTRINNLDIQLSKMKYALRNCLSLIGVFFFFPFACILDISYIAAEASCSEELKKCGFEARTRNLINILFHLLHVIFMSSELLFCFQFHRIRFRPTGGIKCGLMIIMAVNIGLWFLFILHDTKTRHGGSHIDNVTHHCNVTLFLNLTEDLELCLNHTNSAYDVKQTLNRYLYPFNIEFALLIGEFLAAKFFRSSLNKTQELETQTRDISPTVSQSRAEATQLQGLSAGRQSLWSVLIIYAGVFVNLIVFAMSIFDVWSNEARKGSAQVNQRFKLMAKAHPIINVAFMNLLIVAGFRCCSAFHVQRKRLRGIDWLVLISVFGPVLLEMLQITAIARNLWRLDGSVLVLVSKMTTLVEFILQTPFLFYADRWRLGEEQQRQPRFLRLEKILKAIILCMAMSNLTNWVIDSVLLTNTVSIRDLTKDAFINGYDLVIEKLCLPFVIFYRFNSFLLFVRAYLGD